MQVLVDRDVTIDARLDGASGDPVVLIHGFPVSREIWSAQVPALARTHRVIALDLRGIGASSVADGPYLMESLAADVAALLDALAIGRAAIVGHSLGGYVALAFARMFEERVAAMALICSRLAADTPEAAASRRGLAERIEQEGSIEPVLAAYVPRLFAPRTFAERPEIVERVRALAREIDPRGAAALLRGMALRDDAGDIAPDLDVPATVLAGARDAIIPLAEARATAAAFRRGSLVLCERSGHVPMLEEPERVTEALLAVLDR